MRHPINSSLLSLVFALVLVHILSSKAGGQEPFFCDRQGSVLEYERRYVDSGKLRWKHTMTITSITKHRDGREVEYNSLFRKPGGSVMYGGPVAMVSLIDGSGAVSVDISGSAVSLFRNMLPKANVTAEGGKTVLPADLAPGDVLPDVHCVVSTSVGKYRMDITQRRVLRKERLHTPAGDYDCIVLTEHKVEKGLGRNRTTTALSWYAKGVGLVRHDTNDEKNRPQTSEVLTRLLPLSK